MPPLKSPPPFQNVMFQIGSPVAAFMAPIVKPGSKKHLLKGIDFERADSKGLKTLALCWVCRKRAFSVSGSFRKALSDLISDLHNSNKPLVQVTILGEKLVEEKFYLLGFVAGEDIKIKENVWFTALTASIISLLNEANTQGVLVVGVSVRFKVLVGLHDILSENPRIIITGECFSNSDYNWIRNVVASFLHFQGLLNNLADFSAGFLQLLNSGFKPP
jgi:hypothetical protein